MSDGEVLRAGRDGLKERSVTAERACRVRRERERRGGEGLGEDDSSRRNPARTHEGRGGGGVTKVWIVNNGQRRGWWTRTEKEPERREACEKRSGRKAAEVTRMMDESSTPMHRRKKESVYTLYVCVCVCVLREPPLIALAAHRHGGNIFWSATHSKRATRTRMKRRGSMGC